MLRDALRGMVAGAVGTVALNAATYGDVVLRGRPPSQVPARLAGKVSERLGIDLAPEPSEAKDERVENRRRGLGALFGYVTGLSVGAAYGLVRPRLGRVPLPVGGVALGIAAMAASDAPAIATGATDPRSWGAAGWLADLVPHLAYGLVTVAAWESLHAAEAVPRRRSWRSRIPAGAGGAGELAGELAAALRDAGQRVIGQVAAAR